MFTKLYHVHVHLFDARVLARYQLPGSQHRKADNPGRRRIALRLRLGI
jgi:hypothetical protein